MRCPESPRCRCEPLDRRLLLNAVFLTGSELADDMLLTFYSGSLVITWDGHAPDTRSLAGVTDVVLDPQQGSDAIRIEGDVRVRVRVAAGEGDDQCRINTDGMIDNVLQQNIRFEGGDGDDWLFIEDTVADNSGHYIISFTYHVMKGGVVEGALVETYLVEKLVTLESPGDTEYLVVGQPWTDFADIRLHDVGGNDRLTLNGAENDPNVTIDLTDAGGAIGTTALLLDGIENVEAYGGPGNDSIRVTRSTPCKLFGYDGDDTLIGGDAADFIDAGGGNDYCFGGGGNDALYGREDKDTLSGGAGRNTLYGGTGDDRLNGSGGRDYLLGEADADRLYGFGGNDTLDGGGYIDRLFGGDGDDLLYGGGSNDKLYGDAGNDTLYGQTGADILDGGLGTDSAKKDSSDPPPISIEVLL